MTRWPGWPCSVRRARCELMRIAWRTVGAIVARVWADTERQHDRFAGLRRIGVDEISYKRGPAFRSWQAILDTGRGITAAQRGASTSKHAKPLDTRSTAV